MQRKNRKLEFSQRIRSYESKLASMYAKVASLEKGLVRLRQKWQAQDKQEKQSSKPD